MDKEEVDLNKKDRLNIIEELGGPQGIADSSLPGLVFISVFSIFNQDVKMASIAALIFGVALAAIRILKSEPLRFVAAGFIGLLIAAFFATKTGKAENFFLPGLILNGGYALIYLFSILIRWPLIGVIIETGTGKGTVWRDNKTKLRAYSHASFIWVFMFLSRFAVQLPLYLSGSIIALGIVKTFMGIPLFIFAVWLSWLILKSNEIEFKQFVGSFSKKNNPGQ